MLKDQAIIQVWVRIATCTLAIGGFVVSASTAEPSNAEPMAVSGACYRIEFDYNNGSLVRVTSATDGKIIFRSDAPGLWSARFQDGTELHAADYSRTDPARRFRCEMASPDLLRFRYVSKQLQVEVTVIRRSDGVVFASKLKVIAGTMLEFALPGRTVFGRDQLKRFICPANGNNSVGTAFLPSFFTKQPAASETRWQPENIGPRGFHGLFGGYLKTAVELDQAVALQVTEAGRTWLGAPLSERLEVTPTVVNRGGDPEQADLVLVNSRNGPYFYGKQVGHGGFLWRIGGRVERDEDQRRNALWLVGVTLEQLASQKKRVTNTKIGLLALTNGPARGSWTDLSVAEWRDALGRLPVVRSKRIELVELATLKMLDQALAAGNFLAIVNPYGEFLPMPAERKYDDQIESIRQFVDAGGNWFETGGYPFYAAFRPVSEYFQYESGYPPAFADFFHWETKQTTASLYRVAPRTWEPWTAEKDHDAVFTPGRIACGGAESGPWCERPFVTCIRSGESWTSPAVRLRVGNPVQQDLEAYRRENGLGRTLAEKLPAGILDKFRTAVLVKYEGNCADLIEHLDGLPVPSLIHISRYLHGGFDKQYPDHLPPNPEFGTAEQLRHLSEAAHSRGHLLMPYTNPTWWCDEPKGPTFLANGEAPLLRKLDGSLSPERYSRNTGFTICHWHSAVRQANQKTLRQFINDYPVDILFQDQCGARQFRYDTNPASPTPAAYTEGILSMVAEDSGSIPLSTEGGWDQVARYQVQLCGLSWTIVPTEGGPTWRRLMKFEYPPNTWEVFPMAQYLAHRQTAMLGHDLGQFVTNREVLSWMLGLGFSMSYRVQASQLQQSKKHEWLAWLARVQKSVCARYVGQPLVSFEHRRPVPATLQDDGLIHSRYGDVEIYANIGGVAKPLDQVELAPFGFYVRAPDMCAASLCKLGAFRYSDPKTAFVTEMRPGGAEAWVYAQPAQTVAVLLPQEVSGRVLVSCGDQRQSVSVKANHVEFTLPQQQTSSEEAPRTKGNAYVWHVTITANGNGS